MYSRKRQLPEIKDGIKPITKLSQRFMVDKGVLEFIARAANISERDIVLEIGGGLGSLTQVILQHNPCKLIVVEKDARLYAILRQKFTRQSNVHVILGDILEYTPPLSLTKVVSNPPYHIISSLLTKMLEWPFKVAVLTVQREIGYRLVSKPGTKSYGRLSVLYRLGHDIELLRAVPARCFYPKPKVSSVVVRIARTRELNLNYGEFSMFLKQLFAHRRKKLKNSLRSIGLKKQELEHLLKAIKGDKLCERVDKLSPNELLEIYEEYKKAAKKELT
ncbi:MAG: ribosomal RNA small subunit methyltransferase A [Thermoproteota archaeon]|nr:MAG: ribosomal RNA small subunit methyltransferase A [Candidatus Korarchaeota archaeon]